MSKILLICKSTTGFTRRYAEQIVRETGCTLIDFRDVNAEALAGYDTIVFGSRLFAGKIDALDKIRPLVTRTGARFIIFATGATPNEAADVIDTMWRANLTEEELASVPHFYMQAGMAPDKLPASERMMLKLAALFMTHKKNQTDEEKGFADAVSRSFDISDERWARPLIDHLKKEVCK